MDAAYQFLFIREWPWWFSGPLIGLFVGLFVWAQNRLLGLSSAIEAILSVPAARRVEAAFRTSSGQRPRNLTYARSIFILGVFLGSLIDGFWGRGGHYVFSMGDAFAQTFPYSQAVQVGILAFGGVLVGFGARMAGGCPSGHGLSGLSTLSPGSLVAVPSFMASGIIFTLLVTRFF